MERARRHGPSPRDLQFASLSPFLPPVRALTGSWTASSVLSLRLFHRALGWQPHRSPPANSLRPNARGPPFRERVHGQNLNARPCRIVGLAERSTNAGQDLPVVGRLFACGPPAFPDLPEPPEKTFQPARSRFKMAARPSSSSWASRLLMLVVGDPA